jgi:hypothetical protein
VYIAIDICYFIVIYFYFPETKKLSLEEVALVFDYGTKEGSRLARQAMEERLAAESAYTENAQPQEDLKGDVEHREEFRQSR